MDREEGRDGGRERGSQEKLKQIKDFCGMCGAH